ncbi:hypothetical protein [Chryseobacterium sp. SC28]|uniref:hypothetical protein n=1 Tax=Chryseobacterium sp. SC28 TaxID=2268028 RepID=UPI001628B251|nr:hypothetical protein [Chryseobacterium sp. SC28]
MNSLSAKNFGKNKNGMTKPLAPIAVEILFLFFGKRKRLQRKAGNSSKIKLKTGRVVLF